MQILSGISASEGIFSHTESGIPASPIQGPLGAPWLHDNLPVHHYRNASIFHAFELIPAAMVEFLGGVGRQICVASGSVSDNPSGQEERHLHSSCRAPVATRVDRDEFPDSWFTTG